MGWIIEVPSDFRETQNEDSWQAVGDGRVIYISSIVVGAGDASAEDLAKVVAKKLSGAQDSHRVEREGIIAQAEIAAKGTGFVLKGFTCVRGCVATCVIDFERAKEREWAIDTWKSLRREEPATRTPWWKFW